jgi:hypothetical protein
MSSGGSGWSGRDYSQVASDDVEVDVKTLHGDGDGDSQVRPTIYQQRLDYLENRTDVDPNSRTERAQRRLDERKRRQEEQNDSRLSQLYHSWVDEKDDMFAFATEREVTGPKDKDAKLDKESDAAKKKRDEETKRRRMKDQYLNELKAHEEEEQARYAGDCCYSNEKKYVFKW